MDWATIDPTITFNFASPDSFRDLILSVDIAAGGQTRTFTIADAPNTGAPRSYDFSILDLTGSSRALTIHRRNNLWVRGDEVSFKGTTP